MISSAPNGIIIAFSCIMRNLVKIFLGFFAFVMLVGCASQKQVVPAVHRNWMLVEFNNYSKDFLVKNKASLGLSSTKSAKNQYGAFMGCNHMFFNADFKPDGTVKFSDVGSTMMYCDKMMELETQFAKELPQMTRYKIEGHILTLSAENGEKMKFVAEDWD